MRKKVLVVLICLACCFRLAPAQDHESFRYESALPSVEEDGFYNILLKPEHLGHLNSNLSDIRIFNEAQLEVPYILNKDVEKYHYSSFRQYEIIEEKRIPKSHSTYIVHNPQRKEINNLHLIIKNAEVKKDMRLLGSDDLSEWFVVKEKSSLQSINNQRGVSELKLLNFPLSNYQYFKLEITDSLNAPIQITSVGYYEHFSKNGNFQEILPVFADQQDLKKDKISVVRLVFGQPQVVDQLELQVEGSSFYHRNARVEVKSDRGKHRNYYTQQQFILSAASENNVILNGLKTDTLRIVIENKDNPPLKVSVKAWQLNRYLTAYLKKDSDYRIRFGYEALGAPKYDLTYFRDSIPVDIPVIEPGEIIKLEEIKPRLESSSFFNTKLYIWAALITVAIILGYITYKMVKEMERK